MFLTTGKSETSRGSNSSKEKGCNGKGTEGNARTKNVTSTIMVVTILCDFILYVTVYIILAYYNNNIIMP